MEHSALFSFAVVVILVQTASTVEPCREKCTSDSTLQVCLNVGGTPWPVNVSCPPTTPYCEDSQCVPYPPSSQVCQGKATSCIDCKTKLICAMIGDQMQPIMNVTCPSDKPYCDKGECSLTPPRNTSCDTVSNAPSSFRCLDDGYFPAPGDCARYHFCVRGNAYDYDCGGYSGMVYDHSRAMCVRADRAPCFTFSCRGNVGKYLHYGPDNTVYAFCGSEDARSALLARCPPNHRITEVDNGEPTCKLFCSRDGRLPDSEDEARYFECTATAANTFGAPVPNKCPNGSIFDARSERCVVRRRQDGASTTTEPPQRTLNPLP